MCYSFRDLMQEKRGILSDQIINGSEKANPVFEKFFPTSYIKDEYNKDLTDNILQRQTQSKKLAAKYNGKSLVEPRFMLVFDDCLHDDRWQRNNEINTAFMNGRRFNIFLFFLYNM